MRFFALTLCLSVACVGRDPDATACAEGDWSDRCVLEVGDRYLSDGAFRRSEVVRSLANPDNLYSRQRLTAYGLGDRGWDLLPEWNPVTSAVTTDIADALAAGASVRVPTGVAPLWDGHKPTRMADWVALGREVFFRYPIRADAFVEHALRHPEHPSARGLVRTETGTIPGAVVYRDPNGGARVGLTCALCHTASRDAQLVEGAARRSLDYGAMRVALFDAASSPLPPAQRARMLSWGPGRADITEDEDGDPVGIPDLWGLREQSALTQTGAIVHASPVALAIRQETQLVHANQQRVRPPRELSWALAMYLYALTPPASAGKGSRKGEQLFALHCVRCHSNAAYGGDPVDESEVGTDPRLARGGARGTGRYRPPSLLGVAAAAPYLHDGSVPTLEDMFDVRRLQNGYTASPLGPGAVPGHSFGMSLNSDERNELIRFLESL